MMTIHNILAEMDSLFNDFFPWLAARYDATSGGFYYANSSSKMMRPMPDIESSAQALNILERVGLLDSMPTGMRKQMTEFFQHKQQPDTGYFLDSDPNMRDDEVMVARAIGYSLNAIRKLGRAPMYPLPYNANKAPEYMGSPESYVEWMRSVELSNSWRGCDRLATSNVYLKQLDPPTMKIYLQAALELFAALQDPETGLWGEGNLYTRISGTFKLHIFYSNFDVPMPRTDRIYQSILKCLRHEEASDMCFIRNPIHLLSYMKPRISQTELEEILHITTSNMRRLKRADGGFSRELAHSPTAPNVAQVKDGEYYPNMPKSVHLGLGEVEGDMNAGTQAILIRTLCAKLAEQPAPDFSKLTTGFYEMMK